METELRITAHRSGPVSYPEQTIESAKDALEKGADIIEIDLRFTKDKQLAVSHDSNLKRLFGVDKALKSLTLDEYKSLKRIEGEYFGYSFEDYIKADIRPLLLHIKEGGRNIKKIIDFINERDFDNSVIMGVSSPAEIRMVKKYAPGISVLAFMKDKLMLDACIRAGADFIRLWQDWTDEKTIEKIHKSGKEVWIMTGGCDGFDVGETSSEFIDYCIKSGADGILINDISKIK